MRAISFEDMKFAMVSFMNTAAKSVDLTEKPKDWDTTEGDSFSDIQTKTIINPETRKVLYGITMTAVVEDKALRDMIYNLLHTVAFDVPGGKEMIELRTRMWGVVREEDKGT